LLSWRDIAAVATAIVRYFRTEGIHTATVDWVLAFTVMFHAARVQIEDHNPRRTCELRSGSSPKLRCQYYLL